MVGETFGNYRIVRRLGSGAMGTVFLGEHERIARRAAIKVLAPEFAGNPEILARFLDEARATSLIHHPAIVEILDCGMHSGGQPYITMEYLEGETLADLLERVGAIPWQKACAMAVPIAEGLGAAHGRRIVHRDLKPANVMRCHDPEAPPGAAPLSSIKVLDFGVAKLLQDSQSGARTHPGKLLGTPEYMAPEQCGGAGMVDARTDIYALGCVLYEMVCGNPPFPVDNLNDLIVAHRWREPPAAASAAEVPLALDRLISRMLAKRQEDRPPNMESVARALHDLLARPDEVTVEAPLAPTTRPGRPEVPAPPPGDSRPARGRWLTAALAAVGLAAATALVVRAAHHGPTRQAPIVAAPRLIVRPPIAAAGAPPEPAAQAAAATPATRAPLSERTARAGAPAAPVPPMRRHVRESTRARANHPTNVDADGIVNL